MFDSNLNTSRLTDLSWELGGLTLLTEMFIINCYSNQFLVHVEQFPHSLHQEFNT